MLCNMLKCRTEWLVERFTFAIADSAQFELVTSGWHVTRANRMTR